MPLIVLDAGHGPETQGAIADGLETGPRSGAETQEQALTWAIACAVRARFGAAMGTILLTRPKFWDNPSLSARALLAKTSQAALFVSIHANAVTDSDQPEKEPRGIETFYASGSTKGPVLAQALHDSTVEATGAMNRGVHPDSETHVQRVAVLHQTPCPAALIEIGYLTSLWEHAALITPLYQDALAFGIFRGICRAASALGLVDPSAPPPPPIRPATGNTTPAGLVLPFRKP